MRKNRYFRLFIIFVGILLLGCTAFLDTEKQKLPQTQRKESSYTWSSFFNNDCGPAMKLSLNSEGTAILDYQCSKGKEIRQDARRHERLGEVELWAASDLPAEQRYQLSNSKCRASLIYLGPTHTTIEFPCALIRMTVTCNIVSRETIGTATSIHLIPTRALITFSDGYQEFDINEMRFDPRGPFRPFKTPSPSFTHDRAGNQLARF